jgi:hypothetical protein
MNLGCTAFIVLSFFKSVNEQMKKSKKFQIILLMMTAIIFLGIANYLIYDSVREADSLRSQPTFEQPDLKGLVAFSGKELRIVPIFSLSFPLNLRLFDQFFKLSVQDTLLSIKCFTFRC